MKKVALVVLFLVLAGQAYGQTTCTVTGTLYNGDGSLYANKPVTVKKVENMSGVVISTRPFTRYTNASGVITLNIHRNSWAYIYADCWGMRGDNQEGMKKFIPNASSATLDSAGSVVIIALADSNKAATGYATPQFVYDNAGGISAAQVSDSLDLIPRSAISLGVMTDSLDANTVRTETDPVYVAGIASYSTTAAISDSLDAVVRTETDPVYVAGIASYSTTAQMSDSLDAIVRTETDPVYVAGIASYSTTAAISDSLDTVVRAESDPSYTAGIGSYSTTAAISDSLDTVVRAEVDPTATAKAQAVVADSLSGVFGTRSVSSTGRIFVSDDSVAAFTGAINIDASTGNVFRGTTSGDVTATITNMLDGQSITVKVEQGGTNTFVFAGVAWAGGTAPTLTSGAGARDVFTIIKIGGELFGSAVQDMQ